MFAGQSGVGKSSLLNRLEPGLGLRVGEVSAKYDRGAHTTNFAALLRLADGTAVIDTPGIRELDVAGIEPRDLQYFFVEFRRYAARCAYTACLHLDEPDCAVKAAVERGRIHADRYESYTRALRGHAAVLPGTIMDPHTRRLLELPAVIGRLADGVLQRGRARAPAGAGDP